MFAPSGRLHAITVNGEELQEDFWVRPGRLYLLVGPSENSTRTLDEIGADDGLADFRNVDAPPANASDDDPGAEEVATRREQLNWLNPDSLWVTIAAKTGRIVTSPNDTATDPRAFAQNDQEVSAQVAEQIRAARTYARELDSVGGGQ